jgi:hypothetical protein
VQDEPLSLVTLAVHDGVMAGTVMLPTNAYEIGYAGNGLHTVAEIDQSAFPPEAEPVRVDLPQGELGDAVAETVTDDGSIIDVMVVYTPKARQYQGGTAPILSLINNAITETNDTYANSQISQRLRLVYAAEVSYTESGIDTDLTRLQGKSDGYMDVVHTWRNMYGADEVALIVEYPSDYLYCGIAYLMNTLSTGFESYAFAAIERNCTTGNLSFAHELGHNMGAHHDRYAVEKYNQGTGLYSYSYGYVNTTLRWRTIMAYNTACDDLGFYCGRIPYWSNPDVDYYGTPVGTNSADNHRTLNESALTVANFRQSVMDSPPDTPTNLTATAVSPVQINLSWTDNSSDEDGFRIERSSGGSWSPLTSVAANTNSYSNAGLTPLTTYYYRVLAYNDHGDSDYSNVASATTPDVIIGPLVYDGVVIDDDNAGGTVGNDNGSLNCGETVGLTVMLENEGNTAVEGIDNATLSIPSLPGDISSTGNLVSDYPDIVGGASEGSIDAFEFSVQPDAEHGHWIDLKLTITADNWGPGSVEFSLPILCAATADYRVHLPMIFK